MRPVTVDIPHQLGAAEARRRIDQGFAQLAEQMGGSGLSQVTRAWAGDRLSFSVGILGQAITGELLVTDDLVRIELLLPGVLGALARAIKGRVERQGLLLLGKK